MKLTVGIHTGNRLLPRRTGGGGTEPGDTIPDGAIMNMSLTKYLVTGSNKFIVRAGYEN